jgi:hypothetical protein
MHRDLVSKFVRWAVALCIGLPATAALLPLMTMVAFPAAFGLLGLVEPASNSTWYLALMLLWAAAGVAGLCGFWAWVLASRPLSREQRLVFSGCFVAGAVACLPLASHPTPLPLLGAVGLFTSAAIVVSLFWPNSALHPTQASEARLRG